MNQHLLWVLMSVNSGALTLRSVHPASPVLLTKNGPLVTRIRPARSLKQRAALKHLKFENRSKLFQLRNL